MSTHAFARSMGWLRLGLFWAALALLLYMAGKAVLNLGTGSLAGPMSHSPVALAASAALYLASHFVRVARLALITADTRVSLRSLASVHLFTAAVSLAVPFKLGDLYRVIELSALVGGATRGVTLVFVERACDVGLILLLLVAALSFGPAAAGAYGPVLAASLLFVLVTLLVVVLLPDNLRRFGSYVIRRYDRPWSVEVLRRISELRTIIAATAKMLSGRYPSLFAFTFVIWALEASSLTIVLATYAADFHPLGALITFLSSITQGETLLNRLDSAQLAMHSRTALAYLAVTQLPLVAGGLLAGIRLSRITANSASKRGPRSHEDNLP